MGFPTKLFVSGAVAGAALAYYVSSKHTQTGQSYLQIVRQLPGDARRWFDDAKTRATRALEDGKNAARERDEEFGRQLLAAGAPPDA